MREETRLATGQIFQLNSARRKAAEEFLRQGRRGADRRGAERRTAQKAGRGRSEP
jgi:hypothetical protein